MSAVPVHVITGFLGAGKTTLLLDQLARREGRERCAVLVNDFGEARIDASLLGDRVAVTEVAGGCVCCTAPEGLVPAVGAILDEVKPDRLFIEATGLARPADIVDTLRRSGLGARIELAPAVVVLDPQRLIGEAPPLLLEQVDAADVAVLNRVSDASEQALQAWGALAAEQYPPLLAVAQVDHGAVDPDLFELRRSDAHHQRARHEQDHGHSHNHRHQASTEGYAAASRTWPPERLFDAQGLVKLLEGCGAERIKGLFNTDLGWFLLQRASGGVSRVASGRRSGSAVDVIVKGDQPMADALLEQLDAIEYTPPQRSDDPVVMLVDEHGTEAELTRLALAALPGQVPDVGARVPGRTGAGVELAEVLALAGDGSHFIAVAVDGMTTAPAAIAQVGGAVLVHSLDGVGFPSGKGGPFRIFVPPGPDSACSNVKGVARLVLVTP